MWLLNAQTYKLEYFIGKTIPAYAILSHTWETEEVTFQDIRDRPDEAAKLHGHRKIRYTCQEAIKEGLSYAWVDTCCIDKTSSAELSESINSMYGFYQRAKICFVYLSDVSGNGQTITDPRKSTPRDCASEHSVEDQTYDELFSAFGESRWFTRGWCLQELIAPATVRFFDEQFKPIGEKRDLAETLSRTTGIDVSVLLDPLELHEFCIARKMYWASDRVTTRAEDEAYSLMGIFDVNMPLLYGEGGIKAFYRLQQEIIKASTDQSIFAWDAQSMVDDRTNMHYLLASSPGCFRNAATITSWSNTPVQQSFTLNNYGLDIRTQLLTFANETCAVLNCRYEDNFVGPICLNLFQRRIFPEHGPRSRSTSQLYQLGVDFVWDPVRSRVTRLAVKALDEALKAPSANFVIVSPVYREIPSLGLERTTRVLPCYFQLHLDDFVGKQFDIIDAWPRDRWNLQTLVMRGPLPHQEHQWSYVTFKGRASTKIFRVSFSCRYRKLVLDVHNLGTSAGLVKQAPHMHEDQAYLSLYLHGEHIRLQAQMSWERFVMGSALQDIRVSRLGSRTPALIKKCEAIV